MKLHIDELKQRAKDRPKGYLTDCISRGKFDGTWLELDESQFEFLKQRYSNSLPGVLEMLKNFSFSVLAWLDAGFPVTDKHKFQERMSHCIGCFDWIDHRCRKCGCYALKQWLDTEHCPVGKW